MPTSARSRAGNRSIDRFAGATVADEGICAGAVASAAAAAVAVADNVATLAVAVADADADALPVTVAIMANTDVGIGTDRVFDRSIRRSVDMPMPTEGAIDRSTD